ncbi:MAG: hypothetical protein ACD_79C00363G0001 [uncultured bacterium]|nr:MAG: hypothetical protein ACD_79C00363G0001 [uncultured bacterium]
MKLSILPETCSAIMFPHSLADGSINPKTVSFKVTISLGLRDIVELPGSMELAAFLETVILSLNFPFFTASRQVIIFVRLAGYNF